MNNNNISIYERKRYFFCLSLLSGVLLGFSFPPSPFYSLAYIAFIPLFILLVKFDSILKAILYSYIFLLTFHLITAYWIGGFVVGKDVWMMIAGAAFIIIHPIFYLPSIAIAFVMKKKVGIIYGLITFALLWTSFEYIHSLGEYSFPWFTIGNSQAYDINRIQISEYTSVYGMSLIIFSFNIIAFIILWKISIDHLKLWSKQFIALIMTLIAIFFVPSLFGSYLIKTVDNQSEEKIKIGVIQPNFNPWEKWGGSSAEKWDSYNTQYNTFIKESKQLAILKPDLIIWPETAIPFYILMPRYSAYLKGIQSLIDSINIPIYTGIPFIEYFDPKSAPATSQKIDGSDLFYESYNSSVLLMQKQSIGNVHKKTILVPFAERIPYAETFRFLIEPLKWNVGISSWGKGEDTIVCTLPLNDNRKTKFSGMICYESVYPDYVRSFVKRGAEFLIIITNDSWWGNTSGAYQHASFASLRAIETRRWVVQCSNGGISLIVDPAGRIKKEYGLYTKAQFVSDIGVRTTETFYVRNGELVAKICVLFSILIIITLLIQANIFKRKSNGNN